MRRCTTRGCYRPAYWILDDDRGYCTALHLHDEIGAGVLWKAAAERDGVRQVTLV